MKALFCSDLHLKGERPIARLDADWLGTQRSMLREIVSIANNAVVPLILVGDIFDHSRVATEVVNMTISELKLCVGGVWILAGNHEIPQHAYENIEQSSVGILLQYFHDAESLVECNANHFGRDDRPISSFAVPTVRLTHQLIFPDKASKPPTDKGRTAAELLDTYQEADWIICGDGHYGFYFYRGSTGGGRHVVNLGLTIRHKASELTYTPSVWLINTDAELVERIPLTDDPAMITRGHLEEEEDKEDRKREILRIFEVVRNANGSLTIDFMRDLEHLTLRLEGDDLAALQEIIEKTKVESK